MTNTPFERIWDQHVITDLGDARALIHIDRHFAHEGTSARAFDGLRRIGLPVRRPDLTVGTIDHGISTSVGVESWAEADVLAQVGVDRATGYLFGAPQRADRMRCRWHHVPPTRLLGAHGPDRTEHPFIR